jgi:hypothetical protein
MQNAVASLLAGRRVGRCAIVSAAKKQQKQVIVMSLLSAGFRSLFCVFGLACSVAASAHHSFAIFDFQTQIPFEGTVETLKFRNPHIEMTLKTLDENGQEQIVHFIEGAPANMLARSGLRPEMIAPGTRITAVGSPLLEDNSKFFLRLIRLADGKEF